MTRPTTKNQPIEFKGTTLPVVSVTVRTLRIDALNEAAKALFGDEKFFDGDTAVLELDRISEEDSRGFDEWETLRALFAGHGLRLIGVRGGRDELLASAAAAGLPSFTAFKRATRGDSANGSPAVLEAAPSIDVAPQPPAQSPRNDDEATGDTAPSAAQDQVPTRIIDRPLRSGQQVYARGGDLVVLAAVNAGAEVIADGSIHIYAPLRGRALAGASGASDARIFTTRFEAELVSIAGVYRTFDNGIPDQLSGRPVQVRLTETQDGKENDGTSGTSSHLSLTALSTD